MVTNVKKTGGHECGRISKVSKKLRKYFGPPGLSSCELLGGSEERQIFVSVLMIIFAELLPNTLSIL